MAPSWLFARFWHAFLVVYVVLTCLARSVNLPNGLLYLRMFFIIFLFFNGRLSNTCSSEAKGLIITIISGLVEGCKSLFTSLSFLIFARDVPWQPIKVEKSAFFPNQCTLLHCYSETDCNISIPISKGSIE